MKKTVCTLLIALGSLCVVPAPVAQTPQTSLVGPLDRTVIAERQFGRASFVVARGLTIEVGNRSVGPIIINGWSQDVIAAHAMSARGDEVVIVHASETAAGKKLFLKADYADLAMPTAPTTRAVETPPFADNRPLEIQLEIKVPRYAEIERITVIRSKVEISDVDTSITINGDRSSVILKRIGGVEVHTRSGTVEIEGAKGLVQVETLNGAIRVINTRAAVHAVSIGGPIEVRCASDRVDVANTDAPIEVINAEGDVDAVAANSSVRFTGDLRDDRRYYLKSMSGRVEMILPASTHGFTAILSSYRGLVETDFALKSKDPLRAGIFNRRVIGRYGNGKAQITLDSFEGLVRLTKLTGASLERCQLEKSRRDRPSCCESRQMTPLSDRLGAR